MDTSHDPVYGAYRTWVACLCAVHYITGVGPERLIPFRQGPGREVSLGRDALCLLWLSLGAATLPREDWAAQWVRTTVKTVRRHKVRGEEREEFRPGASMVVEVFRRLESSDVHAAIEAGWFGSGKRTARPWREGALLLEKTRGWLQEKFPQGSDPAP